MHPSRSRPVRRRTRALVLGTAVAATVLPLLPSGPVSAAPRAAAPAASTAAAAAVLPYRDASLPVERRVADLLGRMTLEEKVGQMTQAERGAVDADPSVITRLGYGSVLSGGGSVPTPNTPEAWVDLVNRFQEAALATRLDIPMIYGVDAVHGHGNVVGATVLPHNIGLGATRNPRLVERLGHLTAKEVRATGVPWTFAPCVCVSRDERWGRTYESFGEDPALVISLETVIDGLQGRDAYSLDRPDRVLATTKHFAGDGDTTYGTGNGDYTIDQGITERTREQFRRIDLAPYVPAVRKHRTGTVMPSYSSVDFPGDDVGPVKMHAHKGLLTGYLKGELGFDGFVISDWEGILQIPGTREEQVRAGVNAGIDMMMEPNRAPEFVQTLLEEVRAGNVSVRRIDDAVSRILRQKFRLGLFEQPYASKDRTDLVGSEAHRALARNAVAKSQVLLKNEGDVLPLSRGAKLYVAGRNADDIGHQAGGWTRTWQGGTGDTIPGDTVLEGIREVAPDAQVTWSEDASAPTEGSDVGVVVVGESSYSEGFGDVGGPEWPYDPDDAGVPREEKRLTLHEGDQAVVDEVCSALPTCVVLVVSGRPMVLTEQAEQADALVASWLPGSEGTGVADVLFGRKPFTGRLSMSMARSEAQVPVNLGDEQYAPLYPFGLGLRTDDPQERLADARAEAERGDAASRRGLRLVDRALRAGHWTADGEVADAARVRALLLRAVSALERSSGDVSDLQDTAVSVLRDLAMDAVEAGTASPRSSELIAEADHALLVGDEDRAAEELARAIG